MKFCRFEVYGGGVQWINLWHITGIREVKGSGNQNEHCIVTAFGMCIEVKHTAAEVFDIMELVGEDD